MKFDRKLLFMNSLDLKKIMNKNKIVNVLLPVGTIEAHGLIPLGTDAIIPEKLSVDIADQLNALIAPTIVYGITSSLLPYRGSITLSENSFENMIFDIAKSLKKDGFKNLLIINGHGGNISSLKNSSKRIYKELGLFVFIVHWWLLCSKVTDEHFGQTGGHAGLDETAMIQAIDDNLVRWELLDKSVTGRVYRHGFDVIPFPSPIIYYKEGEGKPENNKDKSDKYYIKVKDEVLKTFQKAIEEIDIIFN